MYLIGGNSMTSGASSSCLPIVAPLTIERPNVAFSDVIIRNDNISAIEVIEYKLRAFGTMRDLLSHALKTEILLEVDAAIAQLETEVRR
jgi:hypothetical protein